MVESLVNVYKDRRIFLTGHTGFKGSWLLALLHHLGARVYGYGLPAAESAYILPPLYDRIGGDTLCTSQIADVRDRSALTAALQAAQPEFIFHFAAQALVRRSYAQPVETFEVNGMGTLNLLEAVRTLGLRTTIVVITTDKVYENRELPAYAYTEADALGGYDPYSASKAVAELVVQSYRRSFFHPEKFNTHGVALATARAGNVIGGGDAAQDRIIPDIIRALQAGGKVHVRNPNAVRPWQHVLDPLVGYLRLGAALQQDPVRHSTAYNFGPLPTEVMRVQDVVQLALTAMDKPDQYYSEPQAEAPHEAGLLLLDPAKAMQELRWKPKLSTAEAVKLTMDWYDGKDDLLGYSFYQIENYLSIK